MNQLSLAANIISVIGAAGSATILLEKITKLRHAPQQVLVLFNEVEISSFCDCINLAYSSIGIGLSRSHYYGARSSEKIKESRPIS